MSTPRTALVLGPYSALVARDVTGFAHPDPAGCRCWFLPAPDAREASQ